MQHNILEIQPHFNHCTNEVLDYLTSQSCNQKTKEKWLEKLLIFFEIKHYELFKRGKKNWKTTQTTQQNFTRIFTLLWNQYQSTEDLRYLNTLLKLSENKLVTDSFPHSLRKSLLKELQTLCIK
jgi:hypothetical protein